MIGASVLVSAPAAVADRVLRDIRYGPDPMQMTHVCVPDATAGRPVPGVILIHGGGWHAGRKESLLNICHRFAGAGFVAATIDYRLADGTPGGAWPAQLVDAQLAVRWLRTHAAEYNVDPRHVCAYGTSAGGQIATMLAIEKAVVAGQYADQYPAQSSAVSCAVDNFGPSDLTAPEKPYPDVIARLFPDMPDLERIVAARNASPLYLVNKSTAPIFIAHGEQDKAVAISQSMALVEKLHAAGVQTEFVSYEGGHMWRDMPDDKRDALLDQEIQFVRQVTSR
jgi:acetyl esterase/lipase